jgi:hypothetical protein
MAILIARPLKPLVVFLQWCVVLVLRIRFQNTNHGHRIDEAGDIVDMSIGVVPNDTLP